MNVQLQRKDIHSFTLDRCNNALIKTSNSEISFNAREASVIKDDELKKVTIISNVVIEIDYRNLSNTSMPKIDFGQLVGFIALSRGLIPGQSH